MINEQSINQWVALALEVEAWGLGAELSTPLYAITLFHRLIVLPIVVSHRLGQMDEAAEMNVEAAHRRLEYSVGQKPARLIKDMGGLIPCRIPWAADTWWKMRCF